MKSEEGRKGVRVGHKRGREQRGGREIIRRDMVDCDRDGDGSKEGLSTSFRVGWTFVSRKTKGREKRGGGERREIYQF